MKKTMVTLFLLLIQSGFAQNHSKDWKTDADGSEVRRSKNGVIQKKISGSYSETKIEKFDKNGNLKKRKVVSRMGSPLERNKPFKVKTEKFRKDGSYKEKSKDESVKGLVVHRKTIIDSSNNLVNSSKRISKHSRK